MNDCKRIVRPVGSGLEGFLAILIRFGASNVLITATEAIRSYDENNRMPLINVYLKPQQSMGNDSFNDSS